MSLGGIAAGAVNMAVPSIASSAGQGYLDIQSLHTSFQQALDSEHNFDATGGTWGAHKLGSARMFVAANSKLSSSDTDGRLFLDSTNSRLHHAGSSNTMLLGGQYVTLGAGYTAGSISAAYPSIASCFGMEVSCGTILSGSVGTTLTLANTWYHAVVFVQPTTLNVANQGLGGYPMTLGEIAATNQVGIFNCSTVTAATGTSASTAYGVKVLVVGIKAL